jgi:hypothetical protein
MTDPQTNQNPQAFDDRPVPLQSSSAWQEAEARLYPAITARPDVYMRVVELVRLTVEQLRQLGSSTSALLLAAQRGPDLVLDVLAETGLSAAELDLALVADAALAMRHREVVGEQAVARRLRTLANARHAGQDWVVVEEHGPSEGDPFVPYHRLEVEVATGRALLVTARADEDYTGVVHAVEPLHVDLVTGVVEESRQEGASPTFHPGATARDAHAADLRAETARP